jgi:hypothetical protein
MMETAAGQCPSSQVNVTRRAGPQTATHYRWVAQLWSRRDIRCRASKTRQEEKATQSQGGVWCGPAAASGKAWIFSGGIGPSCRIPPELYRPTGTRRKEPISRRPVQLRQCLCQAPVCGGEIGRETCVRLIPRSPLLTLQERVSFSALVSDWPARTGSPEFGPPERNTFCEAGASTDLGPRLSFPAFRGSIDVCCVN